MGDTHSVNNDGNEDGGGNFWAVLRIFVAADQLVMIAPEQETKNRQNDDGEDGDGKAAKKPGVSWDPGPRTCSREQRQWPERLRTPRVPRALLTKTMLA